MSSRTISVSISVSVKARAMSNYRRERTSVHNISLARTRAAAIARENVSDILRGDSRARFAATIGANDVEMTKADGNKNRLRRVSARVWPRQSRRSFSSDDR